MEGIPLSVDFTQHHFRLLELPPTILALLLSEKPQSLHLKSAVATSLAAAQSVPNAVLCTNDQTFELRQVQSSNVLYILRTSGIETEGKSSLSAAAECQGLLELVPGKEDVVQHLRTLIPVRDAKTASKIEGMAPKCRRLLIDMPFSEQEVASGREELCVCEEQGFCWIPTAKTLKDTWLSIMTATVLNGSSVDKDVDVDRVRQLVVEDGCNTAVFDAILRRNSRWTKSPNRLAFTADRSIAWLGTVLLEANEDSPVKTEQFIAQWKDQLPEAWRAKANLNLLQGKFVSKGESQVMYMDSAQPNSAAAAGAKLLNASKSKWHEKFRKNK